MFLLISEPLLLSGAAEGSPSLLPRQDEHPLHKPLSNENAILHGEREQNGSRGTKPGTTLHIHIHAMGRVLGARGAQKLVKENNESI